MVGGSHQLISEIPDTFRQWSRPIHQLLVWEAGIYFPLVILAVKQLLMENINPWFGKSKRGTPTNVLRWKQTQGYEFISFHRPTLMPAIRQMLLLKQRVLLAILRSPGAYLCLNRAMWESRCPLTKAVELTYSPWHLADAEPPSPVPSFWTFIPPHAVSEWYVLVPWAIQLPASDLRWR